jgi:LMBR1 domain-containing protein 1
MMPLAWILFAIVVLGVLAFCYFIVRYYQDPREAEPLPTFVSTLGLALVLLCVFLIPIDIYSVSTSAGLSAEEMADRAQGIKVLYYVLYCFILAMAFGIIPFAYFYYEEEDEQVTIRQKIWGGCKYTIFLLLIVVIFLAVGLFLFFVKPGDKPTSPGNATDWAKNIIDSQNVPEASISFAIACLTVLGYLSWITYTAYGLSAFPIGIIKGKKHIAEDTSDITSTLQITKEKASAIQSKYLSGQKKMSKKDSEQLDLLKRKERVLARQNLRLRGENTGWRKVWSIFKPFMFIFGILFLLFSILIWVSILLTNIDKAAYSGQFCGSQCGFILAYPKIFNPLDFVLTELAAYFPLDYVLLALIIFYIFFTTLSGVIRIGVRFLWVHMYKIRSKSTPPQGLLLTAIILMFSILALNMELTTLAPQYANWGSQTYTPVNGTSAQQCSLDAPPGACYMTQIGTIVNRISIRTTFFGIIFFAATWIFIVTTFLSFFIAAFKAKSSNVEARESDSDEDEN